jgi:hypothetical protein
MSNRCNRGSRGRGAGCAANGACRAQSQLLSGTYGERVTSDQRRGRTGGPMCEHPIAPWQHVDGDGEVKPYRAPLLVQSMGNAAPQGQGEANGAVLVVLHEESAGLELKSGVPILERKPRWFWDKRRLLSQPFQKPPPASPSALLQASTSASRRPFQSIAAVQHSPVLRWFSGCAAEDDVTAQPLSTPDRPCSFPETHPSEASPLASHPFTTAPPPILSTPTRHCLEHA